MKFRKWIELEEQKEDMVRAARDKKEEFPKLIREFTNKQGDWVEEIQEFINICKSLVPDKDIPLLHPDKQEDRAMWDYKGRSWFYYANRFSKAYGWSLNYISELEAEDALCLIQEMLTDEQLEREFWWGMSEASVTYDKETKTTKSNPLPRPYWMKQTKQTKVAKIKYDPAMMPLVNVNYESVPEELKPKETHA